MKKNIGRVTLQYNEDGTIKYAQYNPLINVPFGKDLLNQLEKIEGKDAQKVEDQAKLVFGAWFDRVSNIELSDRTIHPINSEMELCNKYPNGNPKLCIILFTIEGDI